MAELRAGVGTAVITPPLGAPLGGYFHDRPATAVHDDLLCQTLVIRNDRSEVVFVACDLLGLETETVEAVRREARLGEGSALLAFASHTHLGPQTLPILADRRDEAYLRALPGYIAQAIFQPLPGAGSQIVYRLRLRREDNLPAGLAQAVAEIHVVEVKGELRVEAADLVPGLAADEQEGGHRLLHLALLVIVPPGHSVCPEEPAAREAAGKAQCLPEQPRRGGESAH